MQAFTLQVLQIWAMAEAYLVSLGIHTPLLDLLLGGMLGAASLGGSVSLAKFIVRHVTYAPKNFFGNIRNLKEGAETAGEFLSYLPVPLIMDVVGTVVKILTGFRLRDNAVSGDLLENILAQREQLNAHRSFMTSQLSDLTSQQESDFDHLHTRIETLLEEVEGLKGGALKEEVPLVLPPRSFGDEPETKVLVSAKSWEKVADEMRKGTPALVVKPPVTRELTKEVSVTLSGTPQVICRKTIRLSDGERHGPYMTYHSNGLPEEQGVFQDGKRVGEWRLYDSQGVLKTVSVYSTQGELISKKSPGVAN